MDWPRCLIQYRLLLCVSSRYAEGIITPFTLEIPFNVHDNILRLHCPKTFTASRAQFSTLARKLHARNTNVNFQRSITDFFTDFHYWWYRMFNEHGRVGTVVRTISTIIRTLLSLLLPPSLPPSLSVPRACTVGYDDFTKRRWIFLTRGWGKRATRTSVSQDGRASLTSDTRRSRERPKGYKVC